MSQLQVLMACSDLECRIALGDILAQCGIEPARATNSVEVRTVLTRWPVNLVFCEAALPGGGFREVLRLTKATGGGIPLVVCSRLGDWDEYLKAMQFGVFDFIARPYRRAEVESIVNCARPIYLDKTMGGTRDNIQPSAGSRNDEVWHKSSA